MKALQRTLLAWYATAGRKELPWRATRDPYRIVVSEFMLQQTQVDRVIPKYTAFVSVLPTFAALHAASSADVLRLWKGLGYNSRALRLKALAREVVQQYDGSLPSDANLLLALPGIGAYTVAAIRAFAFELDDIAIDTNVRRVVHRLCFGVEVPPRAAPKAVDPAALALLPQGKAHDWNSALMDLGATICTARAPKCLVCPLRAQCAAAPIDAAGLERARRMHRPARSPQEAIPFARTRRFARGRIVDQLRDLPPGRAISLLDLGAALQPVLQEGAHSLEDALATLVRDGIVRRDGESFALTD